MYYILYCLDLDYEYRDSIKSRQQLVEFDRYLHELCRHVEGFIHQIPVKHSKCLSIDLPPPPSLKMHQLIGVQCIKLQYKKFAKKKYKAARISRISGDYSSKRSHRRRLHTKWKQHRKNYN